MKKGFRLFKKFRLFKNLGKYVLFKKKVPFSVTFMITKKCNYRCKYCDSYNQKAEEMTTEQIFKMIDELNDIGLIRLGLSGGEPLLKKDIGDIIDYANKKGIITTLISNGKLVPQKIKELKNLDVLLISLEGKKENQEKLRGKGSYEDAINAIKIAKENKIEVWTETVITKENLNQIDFLLELAKELNFKCLFQPLINYPLASKKEDIKELSPEKEKYKEIIEFLIEEKKKKKNIVGSMTYLRYIKENWPYGIFKNCLAGKTFCAISPDGQVVPCFFLIDKKDWPNGTKIGFKEAFKKTKLSGCSGCFCNSYLETNFIFSKKIEPKINILKNKNLIR